MSLGNHFPETVTIVEVGPRDGLQNESQLIPTETKIEFIDKLSATGLSVVEATSFVNPKAIPQMQDAAKVFKGIKKRTGTSYPVLVPNSQGLQSAIDSGVSEIAIFTAASDAFNLKNIRKTVEESLISYEPVVKQALSSGLKVRGYISCVLGCPYSGFVQPNKVAEVSRRLYEMGCYSLSMGDTIGVGTPIATRNMISSVCSVVPASAVSVHFHDTYGQGLSNILMALSMGISIVDSSVSGIGGCPFAKGATGNVATEDVVYMLNGMGIKTGVDLDKLVEVGEWISGVLGRDSRSRAGLALARKKQKEIANNK